MVELSILGFGGRGIMFAKIAKEEGYKITAVCDTSEERLGLAKEMFSVPQDKLFTDSDEFFAQGKLSQVLLIATLDDTHHDLAIKALNLGYDLLLEKPIALTMEHIIDIRDTAMRLDRKVGVCHVLRYATIYQKMKEIIDSGAIGEIMNISQTENVGYYHFAHSFVRGNWHNSKETCPSILAKCCHDLDLIVWLTGKDCKQLTSQGMLRYFKVENAPEGATARCKDCPHKETCTYSGYNIYRLHPGMVKQPCVREESVENAFEVMQDNNTFYDKCVYHCDNDVCDQQNVNMILEGDILANLTMQAFSDKIYRRTQVCGTLGEINATFEMDGEMTLSIYGKEPKQFTFTTSDVISHHGGSDRALFLDFMKFVEGNEKSVGLTTIAKSVESHIMAFAAEKSRLENGQPQKLK